MKKTAPLTTVGSAHGAGAEPARTPICGRDERRGSTAETG